MLNLTYRSDGVPHRRGTPVGMQAAGRPLPVCASQHPHLLPHQVLHAQDAGGSHEVVLCPHPQVLEKGAAWQRGATHAQCLTALLQCQHSKERSGRQEEKTHTRPSPPLPSQLLCYFKMPILTEMFHHCLRGAKKSQGGKNTPPPPTHTHTHSHSVILQNGCVD